MIKRLLGKRQQPQDSRISFRLDNGGNPLATFHGSHEILFRKNLSGEWVVSNGTLACSLDLIAGRRG